MTIVLANWGSHLHKGEIEVGYTQWLISTSILLQAIYTEGSTLEFFNVSFSKI